MEHLGYEQTASILIAQENNACIFIVKGSAMYAHAKHIDTCVLRVREFAAGDKPDLQDRRWVSAGRHLHQGVASSGFSLECQPSRETSIRTMTKRHTDPYPLQKMRQRQGCCAPQSACIRGCDQEAGRRRRWWLYVRWRWIGGRGRRSYLIFHLDSNKQHFFSFLEGEGAAPPFQRLLRTQLLRQLPRGLRRRIMWKWMQSRWRRMMKAQLIPLMKTTTILSVRRFHGDFQRVSVCCSVLQCVAVCRSVMQCDAVCCNLLWYTVAVMCCSRYAHPLSLFCVCRRVLQCLAVRCTLLQYIGVCCSVLQCVAVCCSVLQQIHNYQVSFVK